jgi:hypothetical protein
VLALFRNPSACSRGWAAVRSRNGGNGSMHLYFAALQRGL